MSDENSAIAVIVGDAAAAAAVATASELTWPRTVTLKHPVEFGKDNLITALTFRRGRMGDLKGGGMNPSAFPEFDQLALIAARMCGQPTKVIEMLDSDDWAEVQAIVLVFYAKSLVGGRKL